MIFSTSSCQVDQVSNILHFISMCHHFEEMFFLLYFNLSEIKTLFEIKDILHSLSMIMT